MTYTQEISQKHSAFYPEFVPATDSQTQLTAVDHLTQQFGQILENFSLVDPTGAVVQPNTPPSKVQDPSFDITESAPPPSANRSRQLLKRALNNANDSDALRRIISEAADDMTDAPSGWQDALASQSGQDLNSLASIAEALNAVLTMKPGQDGAALVNNLVAAMESFPLSGSPEQWDNAAPILAILTNDNRLTTGSHDGFIVDPTGRSVSGIAVKFMDLDMGPAFQDDKISLPVGTGSYLWRSGDAQFRFTMQDWFSQVGTKFVGGLSRF